MYDFKVNFQKVSFFLPWKNNICHLLQDKWMMLYIFLDPYNYVWNVSFFLFIFKCLLSKLILSLNRYYVENSISAYNAYFQTYST